MRAQVSSANLLYLSDLQILKSVNYMQKDYEKKIAEIEKNAIPDCEIDYSDAPKLSAEQLSQFEARYSVNRDLYKPLKKATTIRLDADCLDYLQHSGAGWQTRVNDFIRKGIVSGQL